MDLKCIGKRIREKRDQQGLTREEVSEMAGISANYLGTIERGEKIPRLEVIIKIANSLKVTSDDLLQDVLDEECRIKMSNYYKEAEKLDNSSKQRLYNIIEAYLKS
ncbi:MAG: helix-turn-helix transcriptional regulator [Lachnospiraceae bacterium]|nr:helix-turn-helix transcriptional regulator [Lachnospiraceae bacterium]